MDSEKRDKTVDVPYVAFESVTARWERANKRLIVVIGILIGLLFASNAIWILSLYGVDFESYEVDADAGQGELNYQYNYIGEDGDINNAENTGKEKENNSQQATRKDYENKGA